MMKYSANSVCDNHAWTMDNLANSYPGHSRMDGCNRTQTRKWSSVIKCTDRVNIKNTVKLKPTGRKMTPVTLGHLFLKQSNVLGTWNISVILYCLIVLISILATETKADSAELLKRQFGSLSHSGTPSSQSDTKPHNTLPTSTRRLPQCKIKCRSLKKRPFCASDGKTYPSKCELRIAIKCAKKDIKIVSKGRCTANKISGSDGGLIGYNGGVSNLPTSNCTVERNKIKAVNRNNAYVPSCYPNGSYKPVQCYKTSGSGGYCWCATTDGKPIPGTSVQESTPNCAEGKKKMSSKTRRGASKKKCSRNDKVEFTKNLVSLFAKDFSRSSLARVADNQDVDVIDWKYDQLDRDQDGLLKYNELKSLRRMVRKLVKPRSCSKRFPNYCDENKDNPLVISKKEWAKCLSDGANISFRLFLSLNSADETGSPIKEVIGLNAPNAGGGGDRGGGGNHDGGGKGQHGTNLQHQATKDIAGENPPGPSLYNKQPGSGLTITHADMPETEPSNDMDCFEDRRQQEENERLYPDGQIFVPECVEGGLYKKDQCHKYTGYCWCVNEITGKPIPGYSTRYQSPDCSKAKPERELKGQDGNIFPSCPYPQKRQYLTLVLDTLSTDMMKYAEENPHKEIQMNPEHTFEETAVRWKFRLLDKNRNEQLDRKETKHLKDLLKTNVQSQGQTKLRKCARNFLRYCDENSNGKISIDEWVQCLKLNEIARQEAENASKRKGVNPLTQFLKSS